MHMVWPGCSVYRRCVFRRLTPSNYQTAWVSLFSAYINRAVILVHKAPYIMSGRIHCVACLRDGTVKCLLACITYSHTEIENIRKEGERTIKSVSTLLHCPWYCIWSHLSYSGWPAGYVAAGLVRWMMGISGQQLVWALQPTSYHRLPHSFLQERSLAVQTRVSPYTLLRLQLSMLDPCQLKAPESTAEKSVNISWHFWEKTYCTYHGH